MASMLVDTEKHGHPVGVVLSFNRNEAFYQSEAPSWRVIEASGWREIISAFRSGGNFDSFQHAVWASGDSLLVLHGVKS